MQVRADCEPLGVKQVRIGRTPYSDHCCHPDLAMVEECHRVFWKMKLKNLSGRIFKKKNIYINGSFPLSTK